MIKNKLIIVLGAGESGVGTAVLAEKYKSAVLSALSRTLMRGKQLSLRSYSFSGELFRKQEQ